MGSSSSHCDKEVAYLAFRSYLWNTLCYDAVLLTKMKRRIQRDQKDRKENSLQNALRDIYLLTKEQNWGGNRIEEALIVVKSFIPSEAVQLVGAYLGMGLMSFDIFLFLLTLIVDEDIYRCLTIAQRIFPSSDDCLTLEEWIVEMKRIYFSSSVPVLRLLILFGYDVHLQSRVSSFENLHFSRLFFEKQALLNNQVVHDRCQLIRIGLFEAVRDIGRSFGYIEEHLRAASVSGRRKIKFIISEKTIVPEGIYLNIYHSHRSYPNILPGILKALNYDHKIVRQKIIIHERKTYYFILTVKW
jgi:hypothetical protein